MVDIDSTTLAIEGITKRHRYMDFINELKSAITGLQEIARALHARKRINQNKPTHESETKNDIILPKTGPQRRKSSPITSFSCMVKQNPD